MSKEFGPPYLYKDLSKLSETERKIARAELEALAPELIKDHKKIEAAYKAVETIATEMAYLHTLPCTPVKGKKLENADNRLIETARYLKNKIIVFIEILDKATAALIEQTQANYALTNKNAVLSEAATTALAVIEGNTRQIAELQEQTIKTEQRIREQKEQIDTVKLHFKPNFKAKIQIQKQDANYRNPYTYGEKPN